MQIGDFGIDQWTHPEDVLVDYTHFRILGVLFTCTDMYLSTAKTSYLNYMIPTHDFEKR